MIPLREGSLVWAIARAFAAQATGYFTVIGVVFLLVWKFGARRLAGARILGRRLFDRAQLRHEITHPLVTLGEGTLSGVAISYLDAAGRTRLTTDASRVGWPFIALTFVALIVFNDGWFYGWHRLLPGYEEVFARRGAGDEARSASAASERAPSVTAVSYPRG